MLAENGMLETSLRNHLKAKASHYKICVRVK
jgi:hypothetical protein